MVQTTYAPSVSKGECFLTFLIIDSIPSHLEESVRFSGLMYGHMGWTLPVQQLYIDCQPSHNILHVLTGTSWGREEQIVKRS
jgi:hypothetical protein